MIRFPFFVLAAGVCLWMAPEAARSQEPSGSINADPNPCRIVPGRHECTTYIRWDTTGVRRAKVFVTAEGRHKDVEKEFGAAERCEGEKCRAPWIREGTRYLFQLIDFSRGDRGRVLSSVTVTAEER